MSIANLRVGDKAVVRFGHWYSDPVEVDKISRKEINLRGSFFAGNKWDRVTGILIGKSTHELSQLVLLDDPDYISYLRTRSLVYHKDLIRSAIGSASLEQTEEILKILGLPNQ